MMSEERMRVLLIEDNPGDQALLRRFLEASRIAFELDCAGDLATGFVCLEARPPDVVLLDLRLPDSNGLATFTRLYERAPGIPIIALTGLDDEALAAEVVLSGAQDYLVKGQFAPALLGRALRYAIERKRGEALLQESNARFRKVFVDGPVAMALFDPELRLLRVNQAFCRMLGYAGEDLVGKAPRITHPEDSALTTQTMQSLFRGEIPNASFEKRYVTSGGGTIWANVTTSVVRDHVGCVLYGIAILEDITERKAATERLGRSRELLAAAQQIAHVGSWEWEVETNRVSWTDELYRIYGLDPQEFHPTFEGYLERVHSGDRDRVRALIERAASERQSFDFEEQIVRPDGSVRILHSRGDVVSRSGRVVRLIGACQDITERKRIEHELEGARDAALQSARLKSAFLANMSHEIRTPLNIILGYNELICDGFEELDSGGRLALVKGVRGAGKRLMSTIDGILDISKIETGNFEVRPVRIDLRALIEQLIADFRLLATEKGLTISCRIEEPAVTVRFDEYCLTNALTNLLQNAIKFTEAGGVWVVLDRGEDGELRLSVGDSGVGIAEAFVPRLFEPFLQEETGTTRRFEGSGLGLALTSEYLELNDARISVESEKGKGSVFRIHFAKASEGIASPPEPFARMA